MRMGKIFFLGLVATSLAVVIHHPASASNKDRTKRAEPQSSCSDSCKPVVRSMFESRPIRKNDCPRARRILM
jgi:hypothetical protein